MKRLMISSILAPLLVGSVFTVIGLVFLLITVNGRRQAEASQAWPSTSGRVVKTWVQETIERDDDGFTEYKYTPHIQYEYSAGGARYTGERLNFGFTSVYGEMGPAEEALDLYPMGSQVTVYYNPEQPQDAVLDREMQGGVLGYVIGGIGLVVAVCMLVLTGLNVIKNLRSQPMMTGN